MTYPDRAAALEAIAAEVRGCTRCRLHQERNAAVPGEGNPSTEVVFVGEAPGFHEDRQGRPFVGQAGSFLNELLGSVGWQRDDVFITNIVKCRPPGNRDPEADEVAACSSYLRRQLEVLDPALIVTLGRHSLASFMPGARIGQAHGTTRPVDPSSGTRDALAFAMYHPAAALHQGTLRQTLLDDMAGVPGALVAARRGRGELADGTPVEPASGAAAEPADGGPLLPPADMESLPDRAPGPDALELVGAGVAAGAEARSGPGEADPGAGDGDQLTLF